MSLFRSGVVCLTVLVAAHSACLAFLAARVAWPADGPLSGWTGAFCVVAVPCFLTAIPLLRRMLFGPLLVVVWSATVLAASLIMGPSAPATPSSPATSAAPEPPATPATPESTSAPEPPAAAPAPPGQPTHEIILAYTGGDNRMVVEVGMLGTDGRARAIPLLFDTGATGTTLNALTLTELGISVLPDAPTIMASTAGGPQEGRLVQVPELRMGGRSLGPINVGTCEPCADDDSRGLLGMNVSGRFLMTVDTVKRTIRLAERGDGPPDLTDDIRPWVGWTSTFAPARGGGGEVTVELRNRGVLPIRGIELRATCSPPASTVAPDLPAGSSATATIPIPPGTSCDGAHVELVHASW